MKCKICGSDSHNFANAKILNKYQVEYFRCSNCGFVQTESPYWLEEAYSEAIASSDVGLVFRIGMFSSLTSKLIFQFFDHQAKFIDYGGGYGLFVRLMRDRGFDFHWLDTFCENLFAKGFEVLEVANNQFEILTAFEVFEHLVDPITEIGEILKYSKNILFSTELLPDACYHPNEWRYYSLIEGQNISLYTLKSLSVIADKFNLKLYSNGSSLHLLTEKDLPSNLFQQLAKEELREVNKVSLLNSDYLKAVGEVNKKENAKELQYSKPELKYNKSESGIKIAVDGVFFQLYKTGIARVWASLLEEWATNGFTQNIIVLDRAETAPKIAGVWYRTIPAYDYNNTDSDRQMLQQVCEEEGVDLFISTYYTTPTNTPSVFMAYDMIPEVVGANFDEPMWREKHNGIRHASAYITISKNTAQDLVKYFPAISSDSVTVAHCGINKTFSPANLQEINLFKTKYGISKPYFILVGATTGYKNIELFLQAFSQLPTKQSFEIVITSHGVLPQYEFRSFTSGSAVHVLYLSDEELRIAYAGAIALVYPSKYEGFGLPVLEALACGCPVITCPNSSIPEVAGNAAIYVDDSDVNAMADALCEVQKPSVRQGLITAGLEQAKKFSWSKMAETVSSALINATLLHLNLRDINLIVFPDWSVDEESLGLELAQVVKAIAIRMCSDRVTLLINHDGVDENEANLLLSSVAMHLVMEEDLEIPDYVEISLLGGLAEIQWRSLLPRIRACISLENENKENKEAIITDYVPVISILDINEVSKYPKRFELDYNLQYKSKEYQIGNHKILLPLDHLLDNYQANWKRYDTVLGDVARIVFQKYPESTAIDIGANVGDTAALINKYIHVPVLCIEGHPDFIPFLKYNAAQIGDIEIAAYFVGEDGESISLENISTDGGTASIVNSVNDAFSHNCIVLKSLSTLIDLYPKFQSTKLLKIDVDGYDFDIINNSVDTISLLQPIICFEYDTSFRATGKAESLNAVENLFKIGYSYFLVYDNFGNYLIHLTEKDIEKFIDLNAYLNCNRHKSGKPAAFYFDIYAFPMVDFDLFSAVRDIEIYD
jgi:FkbM family methyltransferase